MLYVHTHIFMYYEYTCVPLCLFHPPGLCFSLPAAGAPDPAAPSHHTGRPPEWEEEEAEMVKEGRKED